MRHLAVIAAGLTLAATASSASALPQHGLQNAVQAQHSNLALLTKSQAATSPVQLARLGEGHGWRIYRKRAKIQHRKLKRERKMRRKIRRLIRLLDRRSRPMPYWRYRQGKLPIQKRFKSKRKFLEKNVKRNERRGKNVEIRKRRDRVGNGRRGNGSRRPI